MTTDAANYVSIGRNALLSGAGPVNAFGIFFPFHSPARPIVVMSPEVAAGAAAGPPGPGSSTSGWSGRGRCPRPTGLIAALLSASPQSLRRPRSGGVRLRLRARADAGPGRGNRGHVARVRPRGAAQRSAPTDDVAGCSRHHLRHRLPGQGERAAARAASSAGGPSSAAGDRHCACWACSPPSRSRSRAGGSSSTRATWARCTASGPRHGPSASSLRESWRSSSRLPARARRPQLSPTRPAAPRAGPRLASSPSAWAVRSSAFFQFGLRATASSSSGPASTPSTCATGSLVVPISLVAGTGSLVVVPNGCAAGSRRTPRATSTCSCKRWSAASPGARGARGRRSPTALHRAARHLRRTRCDRLGMHPHRLCRSTSSDDRTRTAGAFLLPVVLVLTIAASGLLVVRAARHDLRPSTNGATVPGGGDRRRRRLARRKSAPGDKVVVVHILNYEIAMARPRDPDPYRAPGPERPAAPRPAAGSHARQRSADRLLGRVEDGPASPEFVLRLPARHHRGAARAGRRRRLHRRRHRSQGDDAADRRGTELGRRSRARRGLDHPLRTANAIWTRRIPAWRRAARVDDRRARSLGRALQRLVRSLEAHPATAPPQPERPPTAPWW